MRFLYLALRSSPDKRQLPEERCSEGSLVCGCLVKWGLRLLLYMPCILEDERFYWYLASFAASLSLAVAPLVVAEPPSSTKAWTDVGLLVAIRAPSGCRPTSPRRPARLIRRQALATRAPSTALWFGRRHFSRASGTVHLLTNVVRDWSWMP